MKQLLFTIILLFSINSQAQYKLTKKYSFEGETINYREIDYSKYGTGHIFVTMYEDNDKNKLIEQNASAFLSDKNVYHTLLFFIKIPSKYSFEQREKIFNGIMKEIEAKQKQRNFSLYLNFDIDYSNKYLTDIIQNKLTNKVKRILTHMNSNNIINGLSAMKE